MNDSELIEYAKMKMHKQAWVWRQLFYRGGLDKIRSQGWKPETVAKALSYCKTLSK